MFVYVSLNLVTFVLDLIACEHFSGTFQKVSTIIILEQSDETFLNALTKQCPRSKPTGLKVACGYVRVENGQFECLQGDCMATRSCLCFTRKYGLQDFFSKNTLIFHTAGVAVIFIEMMAVYRLVLVGY